MFRSASSQSQATSFAASLPFARVEPLELGLHPAGRHESTSQVGRGLLGAWRMGTAAHRVLPAVEVLRRAADVIEPTIEEAVGLVGSHLAALHDLREQGIARLLAEVTRFCTYLRLVGVVRLSDVDPSTARDFVEQAVQSGDRWKEPSVSTMYVRRTSIRLLFRTARHLHLGVGDPTIDLVLPPRSERQTRPLCDDEEAIGRIWAQPLLDDTRHAAAWALGQATATNSELAAATVGDVDLESGRIWLHGNEHDREVRWGQLTAWGITRIERRIVAVGDDPAAQLVSAAKASRNARQASSCTAIQRVMTTAGLRDDPAVRPSSLPAWAGVKVYEATGRIDEAAKALGLRSLDAAASHIGLEWQR